MRKLAFTFLILTGLFLAACTAGQPKVSVEATELDLGRVVNGEIISRELIVSNEGEADLVVESLITSCSCTEATMTPMTIPAGESGVLHIEFDSGFHGPDLTGQLIRQVFINSNDPEQPEVKVELTVFVEAPIS